MKIFNAFVIVSGLAAAEDKKVPPRRPGQRLSTLSRFFREFLDSNLYSKRSDRHLRMTHAIEMRLTKRMNDSFERCGFFDPFVPNGGPKQE